MKIMNFYGKLKVKMNNFFLKNSFQAFGKSENAIILVIPRDEKSFLNKKLSDFLEINSVDHITAGILPAVFV